jgi:hypothetical protein
MAEEQTTIEAIHEIVRWLQSNGKSQDVSSICIALNDLAIQSFWFAEEVSRAYSTMNSTEEAYKAAMAKDVAASTLPTAKAERLAEAKYAPLKQEFIEYKNLYNKLRALTERVDRILDHEKQRVSLIKQLDLKNL